ncbi:hypothetical protein ACT6AY_08810 [Campylobacter coli]|uniref:hypothetical protein n=1 Tax=Campylobacter coli TaxID=195 RepID=UPI001DDBB3B9|nr:hypothetical protein [Campylobacter coli]
MENNELDIISIRLDMFLKLKKISKATFYLWKKTKYKNLKTFKKEKRLFIKLKYEEDFLLNDKDEIIIII